MLFPSFVNCVTFPCSSELSLLLPASSVEFLIIGCSAFSAVSFFSVPALPFPEVVILLVSIPILVVPDNSSAFTPSAVHFIDLVLLRMIH